MSVPSPTVYRNLLAEPGCLGDYLDLDVHRGRDRDRLIEWSTALVVLHEVDRLRLAWTGEAKPDLDSLEDRGVRPMPDAFDGGLAPVQADAGVPRPPLHQQDPAGGAARQECFRRRDLFPWPTEVGRFVGDELVVADLVEGAPR